MITRLNGLASEINYLGLDRPPLECNQDLAYRVPRIRQQALSYSAVDRRIFPGQTSVSVYSVCLNPGTVGGNHSVGLASAARVVSVPAHELLKHVRSLPVSCSPPTRASG